MLGIRTLHEILATFITFVLSFNFDVTIKGYFACGVYAELMHMVD